jgi:molybdopterin biosynthesis enzyme MoaB
MSTHSRKSAIPGNTHTTFGPIWGDTTVEALQAHLDKLVRGQQPNMRSNVKYQGEIARLRRAIAARSNWEEDL